MATAFSNSAIFAGLAQGAAQGNKDNYTPEAQANKAAAKVKQAQMEQQLRVTQGTAPTDQDIQTQATINSQQLQATKEQNDQLLAGQFKQRVFDSFDRFSGDHDTRHLNQMLTDARANPYGQKLFGNITRVDPLTSSDAGMIQKAGLDPSLLLEHPEAMASIVKVTNTDGSQEIHNMNELYKMTGYSQYASQKTLDLQKKQADIFKIYNETGAKTPGERAAYDKTVTEGYQPGSDGFTARYLKNRQDMGIGVVASEEEGGDGVANAFKTESEREAYRMTLGQGIKPNTPEFQKQFMSNFEGIQTRNRTPAAIKVTDAVTQTGDDLDAKAQKEYGKPFNQIDFSDPDKKAEFNALITKRQKLGGFDMTTDQRKDYESIKTLASLGPPATQLSSKETGLIDNMLFNVKKYVSNDISGIDAASSYATFRNTIRHALYGSALTDGEIEAFNQQMGSLKQQRGPVLEQFKVGVQQVQAKLEAINDLGDPYITHYRLGVSQKQLSTMVNNLDKLTGSIQHLETSKGSDVPVGGSKPQAAPDNAPVGGAPATAAPLSAEQQSKLDAIFGK